MVYCRFVAIGICRNILFTRLISLKKLCEIVFVSFFQHKFPKAQVNIYITVLQNDGSGKFVLMLLCGLVMNNFDLRMMWHKRSSCRNCGARS